jgi:N-methylhydantoinase B
MRSTKRLVRADGSDEWLPAKCDGVDVKAGDTLFFNTWGGGGWGDPLEREAQLVKVDVDRGLVTRDGAARYGVVIAADGNIDAGATEKLRKTMCAGREDQGLFNFGGTIDEIKARALEETHLPAPESPHLA